MLKPRPFLLPVILSTAFLVAAPSCSGWQAPPTVQIAGDVSNRAAPALAAIMQAEGDAAIARGEDPEQTVAARWAPFWAAWKAWTKAQRAWADAYDAGASDLGQLEAAAGAAFCAARELLPAVAPPELIAVAGIACSALPTLDAGAADAGR